VFGPYCSITPQRDGGELDEAVGLDHHGGETDVERVESGDNAESATSLLDCDTACELGDHQEHESDGEEEEDANECDVGPQGGDEEEESDDEPAGEVDSESALKHLNVTLVGCNDTQVGDVERRKRQPECTIGRKGGSTESITGGELPHASKKLSESSVEEGHADHDIGDSNVTSDYIEHGENVSRASKSEQSKRSGVREHSQVGRGTSVSRCGGIGSLFLVRAVVERRHSFTGDVVAVG